MSTLRINNLKKKLKSDNLDGMIVSHLDHVRYLTGFTGTAGLLVTGPGGTDFFTDFRYADQARQQVKGAKVSIIKRDPVDSLMDFPRLNARRCRYGYNSEYLTVARLNRLGQALPDAIMVPADKLMADLGWVKEKSEIASIKKAVSVSDLAFERVLNLVAPGVRERELAAELEYQMMMLGAEKPAFETIVASGYRSALPHGAASAKKVKKGEFITFDFGATVDGYVSDMTRTIVVGKPTSKQKKIYQIVLRAHKAAIRKVKAGVSGKAVDAAARNIIERAGYGKNFGHGTGHGIGFFIHVGPRLSTASEDKLKINNVITIEPGIYLSGWGGVRIEDDVVVTRNSCKVLNRTPKNLLVL
ncbi:MAG: Xaa-Pro peptidase family protein [bacterium]